MTKRGCCNSCDRSAPASPEPPPPSAPPPLRYTIPVMQEREREKLSGDVRGPTRGDFTDWDNPEDEFLEEEREDAPEGYYDEDELEEELELGPDDPDYDLSEAAGYSPREESGRRTRVPEWVIAALSLLLILSLLLPVLLRFN